MIQTSTTQTLRTARLGPNHGYRIEGDIASLHAEIALERGNAHADWALQLWACDSPFDGGALSGVKIAEAALPLAAAPREPQRLDARAYARLPGGQRDYSMVLVLASGTGGSFDQIHDFANYPARERFITPHLDGSVSYQIDGDQVVLRAEHVRNPRAIDNLSGSLALELWAVKDEYRGGTFQGEWLGGVAIGRIGGQSSLEGLEQRVAFTPPPAGEWHVVLMLREWAQDGYVTRDFCTFAEPFEVAVPAEPVAVQPVAVEPVAVEPVAAKPVAVEPVAAKPVAAKPVAVEPVAVEPVAVEPVAVKPVETASEPAATERVEKAPKSVDDGRVSVLHASVDELARVKGLTRKLAQEIVKARPFESLEELVKVRGIGPKLLVKLRPLIRL